MKNSIFIVCFVLLYSILYVYLNNFELINTSLISNFSLHSKFSLFFSIMLGLFVSVPVYSLIILFFIAILTAVNILLLFQRIKMLRKLGKIDFVVGGSSLLGIINSGCASCGIPLLAFAGLGSSISLLPLKGIEISIFSLLILSISTYYLFKERKKGLVCTIEKK